MKTVWRTYGNNPEVPRKMPTQALPPAGVGQAGSLLGTGNGPPGDNREYRWEALSALTQQYPNLPSPLRMPRSLLLPKLMRARSQDRTQFPIFIKMLFLISPKGTYRWPVDM